MKSQPVEFLEQVEDDLQRAYDYYDSWLADGSEKFHELFRDVIAWVAWNPEMFPKKHRLFRRAIIRNSYFVIEPSVTTVVAVLDMRQNPRTIRRLLRTRRA